MNAVSSGFAPMPAKWPQIPGISRNSLPLTNSLTRCSSSGAKYRSSWPGHLDQLGPDGTERLLGVPVVARCVADVPVFPGPQHRQQVVGVPAQEVSLPEADQEVIERRACDVSPLLVPVELRGQTPTRIHPGERAQADVGLPVGPSVVPRGIRGQRPTPVTAHGLVHRAGGPSLTGRRASRAGTAGSSFDTGSSS